MGKLFYLLIIPFIRFLININHFFYLRTASIKHNQFIDSLIDGDEHDENKKKAAKKAEEWITAHQLEIKKRVLNTGIQDQFVSYMKPLGLGYTQKESLSALDNLLFANADLLQSSRLILKRAKGYYKVQAWLSLSPLFWIELIVFLPRELLKMAGFESEAKGYKNTVNIIQIIYWLVTIIYTVQLLLRQE